MNTLGGSSSSSGHIIIYGAKIPRGSQWILSYRTIQHVWNTHIIQPHHVELIKTCYELKQSYSLGGERAFIIRPQEWLSAVIEPPYGSTATGWSVGDLTDYRWHNLGPAVDDSIALGL